jgi:hypothetical protein
MLEAGELVIIFHASFVLLLVCCASCSAPVACFLSQSRATNGKASKQETNGKKNNRPAAQHERCVENDHEGWRNRE